MSVDLKYGATQLEHFDRSLWFLRNSNSDLLKLVRLVRVPCGLGSQRRLFVVVSWQYPFRARVSAGVCVMWSADRDAPVLPALQRSQFWAPKKLRVPQRRQFIKLNIYPDAGLSFILIETFTPFPPFTPFWLYFSILHTGIFHYIIDSKRRAWRRETNKTRQWFADLLAIETLSHARHTREKTSSHALGSKGGVVSRFVIGYFAGGWGPFVCLDFMRRGFFSRVPRLRRIEGPTPGTRMRWRIEGFLGCAVQLLCISIAIINTFKFLKFKVFRTFKF